MKITFKDVSAREVPMGLLLQADPSKESVEKYLSGASCFCAVVDEEIVGVCVVNSNENDCLEIYNISVLPEKQRRGIGARLLKYVIEQLKNRGESNVELGTGTFGYQLLFYQRAGFRVQSVWKDHFVDNYDESIFECGVQLKDMLRLRLALQSN